MLLGFFPTGAFISYLAAWSLIRDFFPVTTLLILASTRVVTMLTSETSLTTLIAISVILRRRLSELVPHVVIAGLLLINRATATVTDFMPTCTHTTLRLELAIGYLLRLELLFRGDRHVVFFTTRSFFKAALI